MHTFYCRAVWTTATVDSYTHKKKGATDATISVPATTNVSVRAKVRGVRQITFTCLENTIVPLGQLAYSASQLTVKPLARLTLEESSVIIP